MHGSVGTQSNGFAWGTNHYTYAATPRNSQSSSQDHAAKPLSFKSPLQALLLPLFQNSAKWFFSHSLKEYWAFWHKMAFPSFAKTPKVWQCQSEFVLNKTQNNWGEKGYIFSTKVHSGMFPEVLFRCENVGRQRDFEIFWHLHQWIESFFNSIEFLCLSKVKWIEKGLNSLVKMSKFREITLSADVFATKQNLRKHSTVKCRQVQKAPFSLFDGPFFIYSMMRRAYLTCVSCWLFSIYWMVSVSDRASPESTPIVQRCSEKNIANSHHYYALLYIEATHTHPHYYLSFKKFVAAAALVKPFFFFLVHKCQSIDLLFFNMMQST